MSAPNLAAWQEAFTSYLQNGSNEASLGAQISAQHIASEVRLDVYRHAYYARLEEALAHDFPALLAALGDHDFGRLMVEYLRAHPSTSPTLRHLGRALSSWLMLRGMIEHADLAAIEWAVLNVFDASDAPPIDLDTLAQIAQDKWVNLRMRLLPSLSLLKLHSNAAAYWQSQNQVSPKMILAPGKTSCWVLVRSNEGPALVNISEAQHGVLVKINHGETIGAICESLIAREAPKEIPSFVAETLARAVASGWIRALDLK